LRAVRVPSTRPPGRLARRGLVARSVRYGREWRGWACPRSHRVSPAPAAAGPAFQRRPVVATGRTRGSTGTRRSRECSRTAPSALAAGAARGSSGDRGFGKPTTDEPVPPGLRLRGAIAGLAPSQHDHSRSEPLLEQDLGLLEAPLERGRWGPVVLGCAEHRDD